MNILKVFSILSLFLPITSAHADSLPTHSCRDNEIKQFQRDYPNVSIAECYTVCYEGKKDGEVKLIRCFPSGPERGFKDDIYKARNIIGNLDGESLLSAQNDARSAKSLDDFINKLMAYSQVACKNASDTFVEAQRIFDQTKSKYNTAAKQIGCSPEGGNDPHSQTTTY